MYVKVKKYENGEVKGKPYTYNCDLLVNIGDLVIAEFGKAEAILQVTEIDVEKPNFECKDIIEKYSDDEPSELSVIVKELEIKSIDQLPKMQIDVEEVKKKLDVALPDTKNLVITEDNYKDCKAIAKSLKKVAKDFDEQRKAPKRIFKALNEPYEAAMNEIIGYIKTKETDITNITDDYDRKVAEGNLEYAKGEIEKAKAEFNLKPPFDVIEIKPSYENLTATKKAIKQDVREQAQTLALQQNDFLNKKISVNFVVEQANKSLVNKVNSDIYDELIIENTKVLGNIEELLEKVQSDLNEKAEFEKKVAAEAEARIRAEERARAEAKAREEARIREEEAKAETKEEEQEPMEQDIVFDDETPFEDITPFETETPFTEKAIKLIGSEEDLSKIMEFVKQKFPQVKCYE